MRWCIRIFAVAIFFLLAVSLFPRSEQQCEANDQQQNTAAGQQSAATVVTAAVTEPTPYPNTDNPSDEPWYRSDALATWALVLIGGAAAGIALCTLGAIKKQVESGNATVEETQKEFAARYRPRIRVRNFFTDFSQMDMSDAQRKYPTKISFHMVNYGESSAAIVEARAFIYAGMAALPMRPEYEKGTDFVAQIPNAILDSGKGADIGIVGKEYPLLPVYQTTQHALWLIGLISYRGPLAGTVYRTAFARRYSSEQRRFVGNDNSDYEHEE
jgi:hypothetical protein